MIFHTVARDVIPIKIKIGGIVAQQLLQTYIGKIHIKLASVGGREYIDGIVVKGCRDSAHITIYTNVVVVKKSGNGVCRGIHRKIITYDVDCWWG